MSLDEQVPQNAVPSEATAESSTSPTTAAVNNDEEIIARERSEKLIQAKELYSNGSRNFLVKNYVDAADELSRVCAIYAELYGDLADELGMPYLLYAKSLIALSLDENKVVDVPDEEADDDDEEDENNEGDGEGEAEAVSSNTNGNKIVNGKQEEEADSSADAVAVAKDKQGEDTLVSSTDDKKTENGTSSTTAANDAAIIQDDEKPSTSNGIQHVETVETNAAAEEEENDAASNLQLAWEILETAAKIFLRQGASGLPNLAEVQCELGNIQFENCILDAARDDYEKSLKIYYLLEEQKYRRAMAEIHYKIGLSYLMEQLNKEGAASLKEACTLIQGEIDEIKAKEELSEKDKNNIQDMEETKQEIEAKIAEIEDTQAQQLADVRAALDSYIKPIMANAAAAENDDTAAGSSSAATTSATANNTEATSSAAVSVPEKKANDISHLIKRKKPEGSSEAEAASPAKRPAL